MDSLTMRQLAACASCRRQYDVSRMRVGSRFHCRCGAVIRVRAVTAQEAAVVRCRSCGGPRERGARSCRFCGADFTLREQDLQTICPSCLARISDRSRYCHHCATPIAPEEAAGSLTDRPCPACGDKQRLNSRRVGGSELSLLECSRCGGIWLGQDAFRVVLERARTQQQAEPDRPRLRRQGRSSAGAGGQPGRLYRRCPVCSNWMHRKNYARRSGIVIDHCAEHGIWFDCEELDGILRWIRHGGEALAEQQQQEEQRLAAVRQRFKVEPRTDEDGWSLGRYGSRDRGHLLGHVLRALFEI